LITDWSASSYVKWPHNTVSIHAATTHLASWPHSWRSHL